MSLQWPPPPPPVAAGALLRTAPPADAAWAVYFLAGGKPRQLVPTRVLREQARAAAGLPEWLFDESYDAVGDLAETIALLLPPPAQTHALGFYERLGFVAFGPVYDDAGIPHRDMQLAL
mgnify:CR=1 FL=1